VTPAVSTPVRPRHWRRRLIAAGLLLGAVAVAGWWHFLSDTDLDQARAEADRLDPGWRWDELEAKRAAIPDGQNAALVLRAHEGRWWFIRAWENQRLKLPPPNARLSEEWMTAQQAALAKCGPLLGEARRLADFDRGRFPSSTMGYFSLSSAAPHRLRDDAFARIEAGDFDGALVSIRAIITCSRAIGDEPTTDGQAHRVNFRGEALAAVERLLAQSEPPVAALAALQAGLEADDGDDLRLIAARGERALAELGWESVTLWRQMDSRIRQRRFIDRSDYVVRLRALTALIEVLKLPEREQPDRIAALKADPSVSRRYRLGQFNDALFPIDHARLRCAIAALAADRFRRNQGRWPGALDELVTAGLLSAVPLDPFDGQPLRLKRTAGGLILYSVGKDGQDDGGQRIRWDYVWGPSSARGFRLWDPAARRQPPMTPAREGR
jgi:hypothetical protein